MMYFQPPVFCDVDEKDYFQLLIRQFQQVFEVLLTYPRESIFSILPAKNMIFNCSIAFKSSFLLPFFPYSLEQIQVPIFHPRGFSNSYYLATENYCIV